MTDGSIRLKRGVTTNLWISGKAETELSGARESKVDAG
jgi:hypothetical protein